MTCCTWADILTKEEMRKTFPTPTTRVGPIYRAGARIYGSDLAYPLSPSVITAALQVFQGLQETCKKTSVSRMWSNLPASAVEVQRSEGAFLQQLLQPSELLLRPNVCCARHTLQP